MLRRESEALRPGCVALLRYGSARRSFARRWDAPGGRPADILIPFWHPLPPNSTYESNQRTRRSQLLAAASGIAAVESSLKFGN
jgi:hypothetical protein